MSQMEKEAAPGISCETLVKTKSVERDSRLRFSLTLELIRFTELIAWGRHCLKSKGCLEDCIAWSFQTDTASSIHPKAQSWHLTGMPATTTNEFNNVPKTQRTLTPYKLCLWLQLIIEITNICNNWNNKHNKLMKNLQKLKKSRWFKLICTSSIHAMERISPSFNCLPHSPGKMITHCMN